MTITKNLNSKVFPKNALCFLNENRQTVIKGGLNNNKNKIFPNRIKCIIIYKINHVQYMNIKTKDACFKKNIKKHGLYFHYNIREYPLLGIVYVAVRRIPYSCSECLRKISSPHNRSQDKYNQDQCKGDNQNVFIGLFLGLTATEKYSVY